MAQQKTATRIGNDDRRRLANIGLLKASGKLAEVQAKRLARLIRNHPEKARGRA